MVGFSLEAGLVGVSIVISSLVLLGQRRVAIRESIEQLDDRVMPQSDTKLRPILHKVRFRPSLPPNWRIIPSTTVGIRLSRYNNIAGISWPTNITDVSPRLEDEVMSIDGVIWAGTVDYTTETDGFIPENEPVEEAHSEILIEVRWVNSVRCRQVVDQAMARIRAVERAR